VFGITFALEDCAAMTAAVNGHRTVLVVEDSPTEQMMIADYLREAGYSVLVAGDGDEVGEKMRSIAIDLVVLDLILPRVNGYEVCRNLRSNPSTQQIPILMLTQRSSAPEEFYGRRLGANGYLKKPVNPELLVSEVNRLMGTMNRRR
jgi:twitching motility two-component system response regulator PilH